eukprot:TRINITY_DN5502_c0_g1_i1.p1 TRINITY_DN5502_c0_g1~~TRINITY_DN5502_c0_g1_i1.p1  ORF type:complete len:290 (-),score=90.87 TRINITY_DN5502_c0_g1_i1:88-957(-)
MEAREQEAKEQYEKGEYSDAADHYAQLLEEMTAAHGEMDPKCAPLYLMYGKSLLSLAQSEIDVLGMIMKKDMKKKMNKDHGLQLSDSDDDEEQEKPDVADTVESLELAWEILELARLIYSGMDDSKQQLAEVFFTIGHLSMESDNMEQAITDFKECLKVQEAILPDNDRKLAETHYYIALASENLNNFNQSKQHIGIALKILESKTKQLESLDTDDSKNEIKEIQTVVEELKTKLQEFARGEIVAIPKQENLINPGIQSSHIAEVKSDVMVVPTKRKAAVLEPTRESGK